jgi:hypothetical protein
LSFFYLRECISQRFDSGHQKWSISRKLSNVSLWRIPGLRRTCSYLVSILGQMGGDSGLRASGMSQEAATLESQGVSPYAESKMKELLKKLPSKSELGLSLEKEEFRWREEIAVLCRNYIMSNNHLVVSKSRVIGVAA